MHWAGKLKRTGQYFSNNFHPLLKFQATIPKNGPRRPNSPLSLRASKHNSSSPIKGSATAPFLVSVAALPIWSVESNSRSDNEQAFGKYALLRDSVPRRTESGATNIPPTIAFNYSRLSEGERARILILEPGEFGDNLKGRLKHVRSLQNHDYEALSYVWGETSGTHMMSCSGMKIQITANLDAALRRLRFRDQPRLLWVDAICINQDDIIEKNHQV